MNSSDEFRAFLNDIDAYLVTLRALMVDRMERWPDDWRVGLLAPDWRRVRRWYDVLWAFDIEGVRCSSYPDLSKMRTHAFCSPDTYLTFWRNLEPDAAEALPNDILRISRDPRYIAFRCAYDWAVLSAIEINPDERELAEHVRHHHDVFTRPLVDPGEGDDCEPALMAGQPVNLIQRCRSIELESLMPDWKRVEERYAVLCYFHWSGTNSNRHLPSEYPVLCGVDAFLARLSRMARSLQPSVLDCWPIDDPPIIERDPRYIAFRCGFDRQTAGGRWQPSDEELL